ncbi:MAG: fibronectin type III domain-containing protein [Patescibacteria group bacterium]
MKIRAPWIILLAIGCFILPTTILALSPLPPDRDRPSVVSNIRASIGDKEIILSWDPAIDNVGVTGYKIYRGTKSAAQNNGSYNLSSVKVGKVTTKSIKNLLNGRTYYFVITALDAAGNESPSASLEVSAKPIATKSTTIKTVKIEPPPETSTADTENTTELSGVIHSYIGSPPMFYLHTDDGKRYQLLSQKYWRKAVLYTRGLYKGKKVPVKGKLVQNSEGHTFGISYSSINPVESELGLPAELPSSIPSSDLIAKGVIHQMETTQGTGLYLFSEDDGRKFQLFNKPDWQKAWDFMESEKRVAAYGKPVYNKTGHLYGIRFTDLVPLFN